MKKVLFLTLALCGLCFTSCKKEPEPETNPEADNAITAQFKQCLQYLEMTPDALGSTLQSQGYEPRQTPTDYGNGLLCYIYGRQEGPIHYHYNIYLQNGQFVGLEYGERNDYGTGDYLQVRQDAVEALPQIYNFFQPERFNGQTFTIDGDQKGLTFDEIIKFFRDYTYINDGYGESIDGTRSGDYMLGRMYMLNAKYYASVSCQPSNIRLSDVHLFGPGYSTIVYTRAYAESRDDLMSNFN